MVIEARGTYLRTHASALITLKIVSRHPAPAINPRRVIVALWHYCA
jgi:hypothetical protein